MHMGVDALPAACYALPVLVSLLTIRLFYVLWRSGQPSSRPRAGGLRCLIVLGSGEYAARQTFVRYGYLVYETTLTGGRAYA